MQSGSMMKESMQSMQRGSMRMERTEEKDEEGEENEQMDDLDEEKEGDENFKNEEEPKEEKTKGSERRRKDYCMSEAVEKEMEGFLERERLEEEVMVVSKVKEMTGEIVWEYAEYAEREYAEGEGSSCYAFLQLGNLIAEKR